MYNLNGKKMLNAYAVSTTGSVNTIYVNGINSSNTMIDINGNAQTDAYMYYSSTSATVNEGIRLYRRIYITSQNSVTYIAASPASEPSWGSTNLYYDIGYRETQFDETTYSRCSTNYNTLASVSLVGAIPTFTVTNSTDASITFNEITFIIAFRASSTQMKYKAVFAAFPLGNITLAPNESYSFTISNI